MKWRLESLQVGDNIVALFLAQQLFVSWHSVAAGIDQRADVFFRGLLAVLHLFPLEETFKAGAHFLLFAIGVVANRALLEYFFALLLVALCGAIRRQGD